MTADHKDRPGRRGLEESHDTPASFRLLFPHFILKGAFMTTVTESVMRIGVGIDTARYGHRVSFLRDDRKPAARAVTISENRDGYDRLQQHLQALQGKYPSARFHVHLDAAGQYAVNLEAFLRALSLPLTISIGEPKRNKDYHAAVSPKRTTDDTESLAMARFGVVEQPQPTPPIMEEFVILREIAGRLQGQIKDTTRAINRFHNLMSRVFPELATLVKHIDAESILDLLEKYPTPRRIAAAQLESLKKIAWMRSKTAEAIHRAAQQSVASLVGEFAERLVKELIVSIRQCQRNVKALEKILADAILTLPSSGHQQVITVPGIGAVTAAVLVAKIVDIERFATPEKLVGYFGTFPAESSSGVDRQGQPHSPGTMSMCHKGCDLIRRYLWNAAKSAIVHNPQVRALYHRLRARGTRGDVALGHCMRKLLHQVFAVWKTNQPFDPEYAGSRLERDNHVSAITLPMSPEAADSDGAETETTASHNQEPVPDRTVVTAVASLLEPVNNPAAPPHAVNHSSDSTPGIHENAIDFSFVREQITFERILTHLGIRDQFRGRSQLRGPCPLCQSESPRTLSVNLTKNIYRCFSPHCSHGNVLDFWSALQKQPLHTAVRNLASELCLQTQRNP